MKHKCSICGRSYTGFGNNAEPVNSGRCCDRCNWEAEAARQESEAQRQNRERNE